MPLTQLKRKKNNIWNAPPGIPGIETALPLLLNEINRGKLSFGNVKRLLCENPSKIFNIKNKGFIKAHRDLIKSSERGLMHEIFVKLERRQNPSPVNNNRE